MGSSERYPSIPLSGRLASDRGVSSSPSSTSQATPSAPLRPGDCQQLGEVRPQAIQQGSLSWDADRHHPREGLPNGLSYCKIPGSCGQVLSHPTSCKNVVAASMPLDVYGAAYSQGLCPDGPSSLAVVGPLVSSIRLSSSAGSLVVGMRGVHLLVVSGREVTSGVLPRCPLHFAFCTPTHR